MSEGSFFSYRQYGENVLTNKFSNLSNRFEAVPSKSGNPVLDSLILDTKKGQPAFAAITSDNVTALYSVDNGGCLTDVSTVRWQLKGNHDVDIKGQSFKSEEMLVPVRQKWFSNNLFSDRLLTLPVTGATYRFKLRLNEFSLTPTPSMYWWSCYDSKSTPVAAFLLFPNMKKVEFAVSDDGLHLLDTLLPSFIILATENGKWQKVKSTYSKERLEQMLQSSASRSLPPYSSQDMLPMLHRRMIPTSRSRITTRRPRTAGDRPLAEGDTAPPAYARASEDSTPS